MTESPKEDNSEKTPSQTGGHHTDWLEHLAAGPNGIWDSNEASEEERSKGAPHIDDDQEEDATGVGRETYVEPDQAAVQATEEPEEVVEVVRAETDEALLAIAQPAGEATGEAYKESDLGDGNGLETTDLMWLDEMDTVMDTTMNPQENEDRMSPNEAAETPVEEPEQSVASSQIPDDPDETIAWLERLAARQGAPEEELPSVQAAAPEAMPETPDMAETPSDLMDAESADAEPEALIESTDDFSPEALAAEPAPVELDSDEPVLVELDASEIPEDPDEAMAWLERLAAKEEEETFERVAEQPMVDDVSLAEPAGTGDIVPEDLLPTDIAEAQDIGLKDGLGEALDWLEELTVDTGQDADAVQQGEVMATVEEPSTPAVAHDIDEALAGADLLFTEPEAVQVIDEHVEPDQPVEAADFDDSDDAMAWLEQLAARQGAPIEQLTTIDETSEEAAPVDSLVIEPAQEPAETELELAAAVDEVPVMPDEMITGGEEALSLLPEEAEVPDEAEPVEPALIAAEIQETGELELIEQADVQAEDLAWLDTLGAVDAESWLEAEEAGEAVLDAPDADEALIAEHQQQAVTHETREPVAFLPDAPGSEGLAEARLAIEEGGIPVGLSKYSELVEKGELLPFLIDDLEAIYEQRGPEPDLQRVLGDAYARNGQLRKALESYREALDNI